MENALNIVYGLSLVAIITFLIIHFIRQKKQGKTHDKNSEYLSTRLYTIEIKNPTDKPRKAVLFGMNTLFAKENYGSDSLIEINANYDIKYVELLLESAYYPFTVGLVRMYSENEDQLNQEINYYKCDSSGMMCSFPLGVKRSNKESDDRFHKNILDVLSEFYIDAQARLEMDILPNTMLRLHFFLTKQVSLTHALNEDGHRLIKKYRLPHYYKTENK